MAGHDKTTPQGKAFFKQIKELKKLQVRAGFQHGEATDEDSGADLADVAMWNELGTVRSPPRPFLRQSVDNNADKIAALCKSRLRSIARGDKTARQALEDIGIAQKALIQNTIITGEFEPNAPSTIAKKGSDRPLIDTGRMRQSVNFVIVPKGRANG
jgi:hypothetical protein